MTHKILEQALCSDRGTRWVRPRGSRAGTGANAPSQQAILATPAGCTDRRAGQRAPAQGLSPAVPSVVGPPRVSPAERVSISRRLNRRRGPHWISLKRGFLGWLPLQHGARGPRLPKFAPDSPLEGTGFELLVPPAGARLFAANGGLR